jgi:hypothetical protein
MHNKHLFVSRSFHQDLLNTVENAQNILPIIQLGKVVKKLTPQIEAFDEAVEDLRLDHCAKESNIILRDEKGGYKWTAEGEKAFRKAYKSLLEKEVNAPEFEKLSWQELEQAVGIVYLANYLYNFEELLTEFYNFQ